MELAVWMDTQKALLSPNALWKFRLANSAHDLHLKWCPKLSNTIPYQTEHFRTLLTWNKCIAVCWAKHNELFKLAQHPNADNIGIIPCIHHDVHTHSNEIRWALLYLFFAFICVLSSRTTRMTARWIFICMSQFVCLFVHSIRMLQRMAFVLKHIYFFSKRILHTKNSQTREKKEASYNDSTTYVMRCNKKNVLVYGRFRKSPLPIPRRSSIGSSFPFSCTWMPRSNWLQRRRRRRRRRRRQQRHRHAHFGTWKAWESNNWIGHLDIIFKTKIMTTQQCYPGLCKQNAPLFNK